MQLLPILTAVAEQSIPGRPATWQESLRLMGAGWGSIFIVILVIMLCVTFTALVQRLMAMVSAIQNAAAVTIPAGETTWGAVFIANGLQLIIAVLLIVLGATIVVNSMRSYVASKHNSEAKA